MDEPASPAPIGSTAAAHAKPPAQRFDPVYVNAMSHFYRGELGRIMAWRARLDSTTNWAITSTSTIFTVAFSIERVPHIIFFFNVLIVWIMLWIEARRYRFYDAFRARVRMLEAHFMVPMVLQQNQMLQGNWQKLVCEDLLLPSFKISKFEAVGRRLKRNYSFLFGVVLTAWITKIFIHATPKITSWGTFYQALGVARIPPWIIAILFMGTLIAVIGVDVYITRKSSGEVTEFGPNKTLWRL